MLNSIIVGYRIVVKIPQQPEITRIHYTFYDCGKHSTVAHRLTRKGYLSFSLRCC